jgi:hypothetical protein
VADAKFHTPREIPASLPWIGEIGKVEIFEKSHATCINVHVNNSKRILSTEDV